jgi:hypothetical protein
MNSLAAVSVTTPFVTVNTSDYECSTTQVAHAQPLDPASEMQKVGHFELEEALTTVLMTIEGEIDSAVTMGDVFANLD